MTKIRFSDKVASSVLRSRSLEGQVTPAELAEAAKPHDGHNAGYASRDELELAASDLAKGLGRAPTASRAQLDDTKLKLAAVGVHVSDAQLQRVLDRVGDGDGASSPAEVQRALAGIVESARLERLDKVIADGGLPARAGEQARASDAVDGLARRRLTDDFQYAGSGPIKVAFFDADSTLRVSRSGQVSANDDDDVALLPFVADKLKDLQDQGYLIAVVSNQMGVLYGHVSLDDADAALQHTVDSLRALGGNVHYVDFAEARDNNRKPNPGMFDRLEGLLTSTFGSEATIDKSTSIMVGDSSYKRSDTRPDGEAGTRFSNSDRMFAENLGLPFAEPGEFFGWTAYGQRDFDDFDERGRFLKPFDVGHVSRSGPLAIRLGQLTPDEG